MQFLRDLHYEPYSTTVFETALFKEMTRELPLIDTHCHLDDPLFDSDREAVMQRAGAAGLQQYIVPAISVRRFKRILSLSAENKTLHAAYGLHPLYFHEHRESDLQTLETWIDTHNTVAIGECGLDKFDTQSRGSRDLATQKLWFDAQLELAQARKLPVIIHANKAVEEVILCLRKSRHSIGVIHSFNGSYEQARRLIDMGYHLGFGGAITHSRARKLRELVTRIPLQSLLLETDAPFQPVARSGNDSDTLNGPENKQRNEPGFLKSVLESIAGLREESASEIARVTTANASRLFNLPQ